MAFPEPHDGVIHGNISDEEILQKYNDKEARLLTPVIIYISVLLVSGLIGNSLVIYIYKFRFRQSSSRTFILCLALLDTLTCFVGFPYHVLDMLYPYTFTNISVCKCLSYAMSLCLVSSIFVLVVIAIDRYRKICKPFKKQLSDLGTKTTCAAAVLTATIFVIPNVFLYGHSTVAIKGSNVTGVECYISDDFKETAIPFVFNIFLFAIFVLCTLLFAVLYLLVGVKIWNQGQLVTDRRHRRSINLCGGSNEGGQTAEEVLTDKDDSSTNSKGKVFKFRKASNASSKEESRSKPDPTLDKTVPLNQFETEANNEMLDGDVKNQEIKSMAKRNPSIVSMGDEPVYKSTTCPIKDPYSTSSHSSPSLPRKISTTRDIKSFNSKRKLRRLNTMSGSDEEKTGRKLSHRKASRFSHTSRFSFSSGSISRKQQRSLRITFMLFFITLVFVISFLPHLVILALDSVYPDFWSSAAESENLFYNFLFRTYFINNMANPVIYGFLDERFRFEVRLLFRRLAACRCKAIFTR